MSIYTYTFKISNIFCGNCIPKIKKIISNYPIKSLKINIFTKMIKLELFNKKIFKKIKNDLIKNNYKISNDNNYFKNLFLYFIYLFILQIIFVYKPNIYFFNILLSFFIIFNFYKKILKNNICFTDIIFFGSISSFLIGIIDKNNTHFLVSTIIILSIINGRFIIERISNKAIENLEIDRTEEYLKYKNLENHTESILKRNKEFILEKDEKLIFNSNKESIIESNKDLKNNKKLILENNKELILEKNKELNTNNIKDNFVQFQDLRENHIIWLKDNQYILFDGIILEGQSFVDESPITGEIKLKKKQKNDKIFSGSFNKKGKILVRILKIGKETFYSNLLENLNLQKKNDIFYFSIFIFFCTFLLFLTGLINLSIYDSFINSLNLLIIACPCTISYSKNLLVLKNTNSFLKEGIVIKDANFFERIKDINMVIFDKTGTLTEGKLKINRVYTSSSLDNLNLDNVDLNCSLLHNVNLDSSSLDNVNLDSNSLDNVNLDGNSLDNVNLDSNSLDNVNLDSNSLDNVNKEYVNKKDKVNLIESSSLYTYLNGSLNKELYTYRNIKDTYWNENILFNIILEIEKESFHDIADSLINYCEKRINKKIKDFQILKVKNVRGGIYAVIKRENRFFYIKIGNEKILKKRLKNKFNNIEYVNVNNVIDSIIDDYKIFVTINNKLILIFILEDSLTKNALEIINYLKERKIEIEILSGDSILNVKKIANKLKIKNYFGNLKCYEKLNIIKKYLKKNKKIIYIGDNINDYLSLKNSTIGISFSEIFSVGQLNFKKKDFLLLKILFEKSESINLKIKRNFTVSVIYNLFAFCFALLSTYSGRGMVPGISCFCMVLSSLSVILISR